MIRVSERVCAMIRESERASNIIRHWLMLEFLLLL